MMTHLVFRKKCLSITEIVSLFSSNLFKPLRLGREACIELCHMSHLSVFFFPPQWEVFKC